MDLLNSTEDSELKKIFFFLKGVFVQNTLILSKIPLLKMHCFEVSCQFLSLFWMLRR